MIILGLTGSIAMGKSTAATMFRRRRVPVHDADRTVHRLLGFKGGAVEAVEAAFPGVVTQDRVDHSALAALVFNDANALSRLETILHPLVEADQKRFLRRCRLQGHLLVVLDIPLLYETGMDTKCDAVAVVTAPHFVQLQRLLQRPDMHRARIEAVLSRQMSDAEKRAHADFIIPSGLGRAYTYRTIVQIIDSLQRQSRVRQTGTRAFLRQHPHRIYRHRRCSCVK
ncbi:MAG: dephospho-CoA kinase [Hyphomicrobiales bacterium]|nr:dephospho-CoA kinase [Hyphomicrobiales bacterium]